MRINKVFGGDGFMQPVEIAVIVGAAAIVIGVIVAAIIRKKKGISSCDCGCDCAHCKGCGIKKPDNKS